MVNYVFECLEEKCSSQFKLKVDIEITKKNEFIYRDESGKKLKELDGKWLIAKCPFCGKKASNNCTVRKGDNFGQWKNPNEQTRRRQREFEEKGMPKEWAENFYKDACDASKERVNTSKSEDFYKQVEPHIPTMIKEGKIKPTKNKTKRVEYLKNANRELHKAAKRMPKEKK